jgi:hypothetical protein
MSITQQHTQEQISRAYVVAVAGVAGVNLANVREHDYGVDGTFRPIIITQNVKGETIRLENGFSVDFQIKSCVSSVQTPTHIKYDCEADAYNKLILQNSAQGAAPILLLVLSLPREQNKWLWITERALRVRNACYWFYLTGEQTTNRRKKRIDIPRTQLFTPTQLSDIIDRIQLGGTP